MAKIREDLAGVVSVDGFNLSAGDEVPEGVTVGDHVLAQEKAEPVEKPAPRRRSRKSDSEEE